jgi:hypothetical protein
MQEKAKTAYGYTETHEGPIYHLQLGSILCPVALVPSRRNHRGLPFPEKFNGQWVFILPGGRKITADGKPVEAVPSMRSNGITVSLSPRSAHGNQERQVDEDGLALQPRR